MGKKRRIMTSGMKFVKKYRAFLEKAGLTDADEKVIDVPGMDPFISELEAVLLPGQCISFKSFIEGTAGFAANEMIQVTLDGTALPEIAADNAASEHGVTVNGVTQTKGILGAPLNLHGDALFVGSDWQDGDRPLLSAPGTPAILTPGQHTLKVAVKSNNKARFTKTVKLTVAESKVSFPGHEHADFVKKVGPGVADDGAIGNDVEFDNISIDLQASDAAPAAPTGICAGDKTAWGLATHKYNVEIRDAAGDLVAPRAALGAVNANVLTVAAGGNGTLANIMNADAVGTFTVKIIPLNLKDQPQENSSITKTVTTTNA